MRDNEFVHYDRDLLFIGEPIDVPNVGRIRFLSYSEYIRNIYDLSIMNHNVLHFYYHYLKEVDKKDKELLASLEELKKKRLIDIVINNRSILNSYIRIFYLVLDEHNEEEIPTILETIFKNETLFMELRRLILDMQMLVEVEVSPNPEIQKGIEISRKLKSEESGGAGFSDLVTSIVAGTPNSFKDVFGMTAIQVQAIFYRLAAFKSYDRSVLFATVSSEVKIEPWNKKIDLYERETSAISKADFDRKYGNLMR